VRAIGPQPMVAPMTGERDAARAVGHYRAALARLRAGESRPDICEAIEFLAWALATDGQHTDAARLLAFAKQERADMGIVMPPIDRPHHDRALQTVRAALGEQGFAAAWAEGRARDPEATLAQLVEELG